MITLEKLLTELKLESLHEIVASSGGVSKKSAASQDKSKREKRKEKRAKRKAARKGL